MTRAEIEALLAEAVDDPRNGGFWWPGKKMAPIAYRRWASFARRSRSKRPTDEERVLDLAKGLQAHFEPSRLYTPMAEWLPLAQVLADVLRTHVASSSDSA
jgi:hypothetical protein